MTPEILRKASLNKPSEALINAATSQRLPLLVQNRKILSGKDSFFSSSIDSGSVMHQYATGRCWMFGAVSTLTAGVIRNLKLKDFRFSHTYLYFWDKFEKANLFYELMIKYSDRDIMDRELRFYLKDPSPDGGHWNYAADLINKYGMAPESAMLDSYHTKDSSQLNYVLGRLLRKHAFEIRTLAAEGVGLEDLRLRKEEYLKEIYSLLAMFLGEPPERFPVVLSYKNGRDIVKRDVDALQLKDMLGVKPDDYISVFSNPAWENMSVYEIEDNKNIAERPDFKMLNVTDMPLLKQIMLTSVKAGDPVMIALDSWNDMNKLTGIMAVDLFDYQPLLNINFKADKKDRFLYGSSFPTHVMSIVGVDEINNKTVKWLAKNSWGTSFGENGYCVIYDSWIDENVYQFVFLRKYATSRMLKAEKSESEILPSYDLMR